MDRIALDNAASRQGRLCWNQGDGFRLQPEVQHFPPKAEHTTKAEATPVSARERAISEARTGACGSGAGPRKRPSRRLRYASASSPEARRRRLGAWADPTWLCSVDWAMEGQAASEVGKLLAKNQAAAVQTRLKCLIFDPENRARLFGRHLPGYREA